jgi:hypothetical protein
MIDGRSRVSRAEYGAGVAHGAGDHIDIDIQERDDRYANRARSSRRKAITATTKNSTL